MDFTQIVTRLNELSTFMNNVLTLSKKIPELPVSRPGNKTVAVYNDSQQRTEQFDLTAVLSGVFSVTDGMLTYGDITRVADDFTFVVGFTGRINGVIRANATDIERTIDTAGSGNHRIDIAVLDENNDIYIIQGFEVTLAQELSQPVPEPNTLYICSFIIEEDVISEPVFDGSYLFLQKVRIRKGYGNFNTAVNEVGDIFQFGFVRTEDSVKCFADFAVYTGGDILDNSNYTDMTVKEIS